MPAAAVIPAPVAYIKVVAVKKLVVGFLVRSICPTAVKVVRDGFVPAILSEKLGWHSFVGLVHLDLLL